MGFRYVEYDKLSKYIRESIATEIRSHRLNDKNLQRALKYLFIGHPERATQCRYLLAVLGCLDKPYAKDQKRILNAAAYYIRDQIFESYQGKVTPIFLVPENSTLFNSLTTSLDLTKENFPDSKDLLEMYISLGKFMQTHTYKDSDPERGYLEPASQSFSRRKIRGFEVEEVLQDLVKKIAELRLKQIEQTKEKQLAKEPEKKSGVSTLGLFGSKNNDLHPDITVPSEQISVSVSVQCS